MSPAPEHYEVSPDNVQAALNSCGVALVRGLLERELAISIGKRIAANVESLKELHPDYKTNATRNVFSLALGFSQGDSTLRDRMTAAAAKNAFAGAEFISDAEHATFRREVGSVIERACPEYKVGPLYHAYSRYESARPNSPFGRYLLHQDGCLGEHRSARPDSLDRLVGVRTRCALAHFPAKKVQRPRLAHLAGIARNLALAVPQKVVCPPDLPAGRCSNFHRVDGSWDLR